MGSAPTGEAGQQGTRSSIQCGSNVERVGPCPYPLPIHAEQAGRVASQDRRLLLVVAMNENPPPEDQIKALLPMFAPLGLELGKQWDRSKLDPAVLTAMKQAVLKLPDTLRAGLWHPSKGWAIGALITLGVLTPPASVSPGTSRTKHTT